MARASIPSSARIAREGVRASTFLERAGLIEREKQGREVLISFRGEPLRDVAGWVHEYEQFWNRQLGQFEQHFKNKKVNEERSR